MWQKIVNSRFVEKWGVVFGALFKPGSLISLVITVASLYFSIKYKENIPFSNLMAIVGSIFGGIAGAFFKDEYDRISNRNILEKKGRSAVRNIEGIRAQLRNIEAWIIEFSKRTRKQEDKRTLEEVNRHVATIDLNITAGLADWIDIVPELKQKEELQRTQKDTIQSYIDEILKSKKTLLHANEKDGKIIQKRIEDLEKEIKGLKNDSGLILSSGGVVNPDSYILGSSLWDSNKNHIVGNFDFNDLNSYAESIKDIADKNEK